MDEQQRGRIRDDLKGIIKGELLFDDPMLSLYSTDASIFQVRPLGVVVPLACAGVIGAFSGPYAGGGAEMAGLNSSAGTDSGFA